MKFSFNWIRELVDGLTQEPDSLERLITMKTAECEGIERVGVLLDMACAARVEDVEPVAGTGYGVSEAPRGLLYHSYRLDADGTILDAKIVPPTSQNQRTIEEDLRGVVERSLDTTDRELTDLCEQAIRNYDPCISCATHFLRLEVERC